MYFWSLYFGLSLNLIPKLILLLGQSLKSENQFYFDFYRQPTNRKYICGRRNTLFADMANKIIVKNMYLAFSKCHITFKLIKKCQLRKFN